MLRNSIKYYDNPNTILPDPVFYYHASWTISKIKLKSHLVEYMAVGLMTVLIDMPYDIIGPKYVHWIWHDTDPNICIFDFITFSIFSNFSNGFRFLVKMIAIIGCRGTRITSICVSLSAFNFGFTLYENGLRNGKT